MAYNKENSYPEFTLRGKKKKKLLQQTLFAVLLKLVWIKFVFCTTILLLALLLLIYLLMKIIKIIIFVRGTLSS